MPTLGSLGMRKAKISFALTVVASTALLFLPLYSSATKRSLIPLHSTARGSYYLGHETLAGVNGPGVYLVLAIPVLMASLPLLVRGRAVRLVSALLLMGFVVVGLASVGLFYVPSAISMILAAWEHVA